MGKMMMGYMSGYLLSFGKLVKTSPRCFSKEFNYTRNVQHTFVQEMMKAEGSFQLKRARQDVIRLVKADPSPEPWRALESWERAEADTRGTRAEKHGYDFNDALSHHHYNHHHPTIKRTKPWFDQEIN